MKSDEMKSEKHVTNFNPRTFAQELLESGCTIGTNVVESNFPKKTYVYGETQLHLVHFGDNKTLTHQKAIKELDSKGFIPADHNHLLAFARQHFRIQKGRPIIALGSGKVNYVLVLHNNLKDRTIEAVSVDSVFTSCSWFLAIENPNKKRKKK